MLATVKGVIRDNIVVTKNEDMTEYDGTEAVVILLEHPKKSRKKPSVNWDGYVMPSERGKDVEGYMREMRENILCRIGLQQDI